MVPGAEAPAVMKEEEGGSAKKELDELVQNPDVDTRELAAITLTTKVTL